MHKYPKLAQMITSIREHYTANCGDIVIRLEYSYAETFRKHKQP